MTVKTNKSWDIFWRCQARRAVGDFPSPKFTTQYEEEYVRYMAYILLTWRTSRSRDIFNTPTFF